ncbi:arsenite efflux transporter metallochaperone ArsD [Virgibacillus dakarensis]|uniref:Arsenical resistance operon transcriptional repressor ArsD n=1 Tax=Virgibacillus halodenitrificans TaxID=1482 RepID=A0AAC9J0D0_VIRHA|nr:MULTISPECIES: arsenite efflux transporter metallochaperone ArsD [Virgibacillus]APC49066.1 arsenical resistance operon transcriptional repressor ArsD [Virgibacillus halodenitrificans]MBT2217874.1 arsenite efflux transporter metallochaperone ArsD [Virgibacillus dakarensis]MTW87553.1 arsenite efflux transporter metallochaperone ArsD [Virgibacillus dakarensis]
MKKVEIFDPAMCCSTGVCGPSVDPNLTRVASAVYSLGQKDVDIKRFNLANEPAAFAENETVNQVLQEKGADALPVTLLDGEVVKVGEYPTNEEFAEWLEVRAKELTQKPRVRVSVKLD